MKSKFCKNHFKNIIKDLKRIKKFIKNLIRVEKV